LTKTWVDVRHAKPPPEFVDAIANDLNTSLALTLIGKYLKNLQEFDLVGALELLGFNVNDLKQRFAPFASRASENSYGAGHSIRTYGDKASSFADRLAALTIELRRLHRQAIETKDFSEVDELKSILVSAGIEVRMSKTGVELVRGPDFDPAKLEALK
ncbi:MAG TPA: hypothetical protein PK450_07650, partial [Paracoccaceae bacterium]|nr:hypothetical protein [Paracoccaceae bacterium]